MSESGPNLLVIGAARSSTTALCHSLQHRGDVFMTKPKEPHFFAFAGSRPSFAGPGDEQSINRVAVVEPDLYHLLYENRGSAQRWGEGSVSTLFYPTQSIPNVRKYASSDVKLVCILREPAARSLSAYLYLRGRGLEPESEFVNALALEDERIRRNYHHMWQYRAMSRYALQVVPFADAFPGRLLILISEEVRLDPVGSSRQLCDFLEIDRHPQLDLTREVNRGGQPRSRLVASMIGGLWRSPAAGGLVKAVVPRRVRSKLMDLNRVSLREARTLARSLRPEFEADVAAVEQILGRRLGVWREE